MNFILGDGSCVPHCLITGAKFYRQIGRVRFVIGGYYLRMMRKSAAPGRCPISFSRYRAWEKREIEKEREKEEEEEEAACREFPNEFECERREVRRPSGASTTRNLHFLRLSRHITTEIDRRVVSHAREFQARSTSESHGSGMMMFRGRLRFPPASSALVPREYRLVDRSSATCLAGNTDRNAKITLASLARGERAKRETERERKKENATYTDAWDGG